MREIQSGRSSAGQIEPLTMHSILANMLEAGRGEGVDQSARALRRLALEDELRGSLSGKASGRPCVLALATI